MTHDNPTVQKLMEGVANHLSDVIGTECRRLEKAYNAGKLDGYSNGHDAEYKRGLEDAWNMARKLLLTPDKGGLSLKELTEIYDLLSVERASDILSECDILSVMPAVRDWEMAKEKERQEAEGERWIYQKTVGWCMANQYGCPVCGGNVKVEFGENLPPYCPKCGTRIQEVGND